MVRTVEQTRMGIAAPLVSNIGWGVLPLYWRTLSSMNAISVLEPMRAQGYAAFMVIWVAIAVYSFGAIRAYRERLKPYAR